MNMVTEAAQCGRNVFYAQPYSLDAQGFYFASHEEFERQAGGCRDRFGSAVEEFEIQLIEGPDAELCQAAGLDQSNLKLLEDLEGLDDGQKVSVFFLLDHGIVPDVEGAIDKAQDVILFEGTLQDAAEELFDELYGDQLPASLLYYIDYEAYARDLRLSGEFVQFEFEGAVYTCTNANSI